MMNTRFTSTEAAHASMRVLGMIHGNTRVHQLTQSRGKSAFSTLMPSTGQSSLQAQKSDTTVSVPSRNVKCLTTTAAGGAHQQSFQATCSIPSCWQSKSASRAPALPYAAPHHEC